MRIQYKLAVRRGHRQRTFLTSPVAKAATRAPRIARMLALAHKLDRLVQSGEVKDYRELARLGHVTPSRVSQVLMLVQLAPSIQEHVLFADAVEAHLLTEAELRKIAREPHWDRQHMQFLLLIKPTD